MDTKNADIFPCKACNVICSSNHELDLHKLTASHKRIFTKTLKPANKFCCDACDFKCSKHSDWQRHILRPKHKRIFLDIHPPEQNAHYECELCHKNYKYNSGLWKHKKFCSADNVQVHKQEKESEHDNELVSIIIKDNINFKNLVLDVIKSNTDLQKQCTEFQKQNNELQKQNTEFQKIMMEVCKNLPSSQSTNIINSHNKTFNLQVFLNEECKDAMNLSDFVDSFQLQFADLESVGELGYVEGMSQIIIKKLNEMDVHKRPIHCSDAKRDILHIKANNKWERETPEYSHLKGAIKRISNKNIDILFDWRNKHPNVQDSHNRHNDQYLNMIKQVMGGSGEINDSERKIIKNIAKQVMIEK